MAIDNYGDSSILSSSLTQVQQLLGAWAYDSMSGGVIQDVVFGGSTIAPY